MDSYMKKMVAVFVLSIVAVITAESIRYLAAIDSREQLMVVHDADPGADDAMAMLMLLSGKSRAQLIAVTCVTGNTGVTNGTQNAWLTLEVANRTEIPVHRGAAHGLVSDIRSDNYFGYDGLGDAMPKPLEALVAERHAAAALVDIVKTHPGKVSVLCTGPLTNIALAIHLYPKFLEEIKEMVVFGGSYRGGGNKKPGAEFNIVFDPEAAALVFSKAPQDKLIKLVPLETVESNSLPLDWRLNALGGLDSNWIRFLNLAEGKTFPKISKWSPFDQTAAAILLDPKIATAWTDTKIYVETCGEHGRGAVFVDYQSTTSNVRIITDVNIDLIKNMLLSYLA
ncbi:unnamed protein product [Nezara viridula]|uniref:Inosine/uridine-preferring nucleoside hydrolase domain-containing protein n=1 Tax=Nezara viridula TaxID=85310 RepID=A0A9P0MWZ4_NEZVI|nr:unnamed protein product [Nezara viridula]